MHFETQALFIKSGMVEEGSHTEHEVAEVQFKQGDIQVVHLFTLLVYVPTGHPKEGG
jgi:hypothetical protein